VSVVGLLYFLGSDWISSISRGFDNLSTKDVLLNDGCNFVPQETLASDGYCTGYLKMRNDLSEAKRSLEKLSREAACGKHPDDYSSSEVIAWLSEMGLPQFASGFESFSISGGTMRKLEMPHLEAFVSHPLHQAKIVGEWEVLRSNQDNCLKGVIGATSVGPFQPACPCHLPLSID
jgi:hypothetical protein